MSTLYFAHSMRTYDGELEMYVKEYMYRIHNNFGCNIVCPNKDKHIVLACDDEKKIAAMYGSEVMQRCFTFIENEADGLIVLAVRGYVSRGAFDEAHLALRMGKPVLIIDINPSRMYVHTMSKKMLKINDPNDWAGNYGSTDLCPDDFPDKRTFKLREVYSNVEDISDFVNQLLIKEYQR